MSEEQPKRKLAAILSVDVAGYSRLMEDDEEATVRTITAYRELMVSQIQNQNGRVVDAKGDNLLAEFSSVVDAVGCAVEIQREIGRRNVELPEHRKMEFRIGVNLGDVIEEGQTIYGDGVNIAARLEALAESGGICISGTAFDQMKRRLSVGYEYLGEQAVKNIETSVRAYRVLMEPEAAGKVIGEKRFLGRISRRAAIAAIITLVVIAGGLGGWLIHLHQSKRIEPASLDKMAYPLPDKPSIAVLPFNNLSGDPKQEYFSDGLTEEIITGLSMVPSLFVIARNSSFIYKGKPVKVQQVSEELGVRYVLEGSVQKEGDRVRITAQLIDAVSGYHKWSKRYDRELKDIFAVQDEITKKIITAMHVELTEGEQAHIWAKGTENLDAYLKFLESREYFSHFNKESNARARQLANEAIALDPEYALAYGRLGFTHWADLIMNWGESRAESFKQLTKSAKKGLELDESEPLLHALQSQIYLMKKQFEKAASEGEKAVSLSPSYADAYVFLGHTLRFLGKPEEAIMVVKKAIRLNPFPTVMYYHNLGIAYLFAGMRDEALATYQKAIKMDPNNLPVNIGLAVTYSSLGQEEEARAIGENIRKMNPKFSLEEFANRLPYRNQAYRDLLIDGLRKAGLK